MGIVDGLTALAVIIGFLYIILAQMTKKNPELLDKLKKYFTSTPKPQEEVRDRMEQIYPEKRMGL
ncbi:hypothetical protein LCGC14_0477560 [marine sediment metagenome]|uniref:Uncharacterized protein n=1 Tax=marine sediment metagenome TaxID=412755 RepID=A0A0F9SAB1_9ZZZZ